MNTITTKLKEAAIFALYIIGMNVLMILCWYIDFKVIHALLRITH